MTPSAADRMATMMRALAEVVLPAIDPANSLAVEQARLVLGHLAVLSGQGDEARLDALELASEQDLARQLVALPAGGPLSAAALANLATALATVRLLLPFLEDSMVLLGTATKMLAPSI